MEPSRDLMDSIYREKILRARREPIERKILAGAELFEGACDRMAAGLRGEHPLADEDTIRALLRQRLDRLRRLRATDERE